MTDQEKAQMLDFIHMLRTCPRQGEIYDIPEGSKYITLSDTLARDVAKVLDRLVAESGR